MKKIFLLLAAATMMASSAMAQMSLVKEVEKAAASNNVQELRSALEKIQPALTNAETMNNAQTWFAAGKVALKLFDQLQGQKAVQQTVDEDLMGMALTSGYDYLLKALPLDSVKETNKDGSFKLEKNGMPKIKTKFSKDIIPLLTGHINDIADLGNTYLTAEKWIEAAKAYGNYCDINQSSFAKANGLTVPDSVIAQVRFFQGYALYNGKDFAGAYPQLSFALKNGYTENQIEAYTTSALANIVQGYLDEKDYASAYNYIDNAIANDNDNATLYDMKGFTAELDKGIEAAIPFYQKAIEVNGNYAQAYYDLGRCYYMQAQDIIDNNPTKTNAEFKELLTPYYNKALPLLEKACQLDEANKDKSKRIVDDIQYKMELMGVK